MNLLEELETLPKSEQLPFAKSALEYLLGTPERAVQWEEKLGMTPTHAKLFQTLYEKRGEYVRARTLLTLCFLNEGKDVFDGTIRVHIYNLKKFLKERYGHSFIDGRWGRGYRLDSIIEEYV